MNARSWQTSAAGAVAAVGVILGIILPRIGIEIAGTKVDELAGAVVFLIGLLWGGLAARDDNVSSEGRRAPKARGLLILLAFAPAMLLSPGCAGPSFAMDSEGIHAGNAPVNTQRTDDTTWQTSLYGGMPTHTVVDADGVNNASEGPHRTMSIALEGVVITLTDPLDGSLKGLRFTMPDGPTLELDEFVSQPSVTIAAKETAIVQSLATQGLITQEQAGVWTSLIEAGSASLVELIAGLGG